MKHRLTALVVVLTLASLTLAFAQATPDSAKKAEPQKAAVMEKAEKAHMEKAGKAGMNETVMQRINGANTLKTLAGLLQTAGLDAELGGTGEYTVFAPSDEAFAKIPADTLNALKQDKARLTELLKAHIVAGKRIGMRELAKMKGQSVKAESGAELGIGDSGGKLMIGHAGMTGVNLPASNGAIHEIDTVLMPGMTSASTATKTAPAMKATEKMEKKQAKNAAAAQKDEAK